MSNFVIYSKQCQSYYLFKQPWVINPWVNTSSNSQWLPQSKQLCSVFLLIWSPHYCNVCGTEHSRCKVYCSNEVFYSMRLDFLHYDEWWSQLCSWNHPTSATPFNPTSSQAVFPWKLFSPWYCLTYCLMISTELLVHLTESSFSPSS